MAQVDFEDDEKTERRDSDSTLLSREKQRLSILRSLLCGQQPQEIRQPKNLDTFILNQRQQLTVACDDEVRVRFYGDRKSTRLNSSHG